MVKVNCSQQLIASIPLSGKRRHGPFCSSRKRLIDAYCSSRKRLIDACCFRRLKANASLASATMLCGFGDRATF
jgi:hypothetical protein